MPKGAFERTAKLHFPTAPNYHIDISAPALVQTFICLVTKRERADKASAAENQKLHYCLQR